MLRMKGISDYIAIFRALKRCPVVVALFLLSDCVAIPTFVPKPFDGEATKAIEPGISTRKDILATLGSPSRTSTDGNIILYRKDHASALLVGYGVDLLVVTNFFVIKFTSNGIVEHARAVTDINDYCLTNGQCLVSSSDLDIWSESTMTVASAKSFKPLAKNCSVYVLGGSFGYPTFEALFSPYKRARRLSVDGSDTYRFPDRSQETENPDPLKISNWVQRNYFFWLVLTPGPHEIVHLRKTSLKEHLVPYRFRCQAGDIQFLGGSKVLLGEKPGIFSGQEPDFSHGFKPIDPEKAKRTIKGMKLLARTN